MNPIPLPALLLVSATALAGQRIAIPAGPFQMGCSPGDDWCENDEGPPGGIRVEVPAFRIDPTEVTVADYRACVRAGQCREPKTHARNQYCNYGAPNRDQHPVNCIDWADAQHYCEVHGGRLPWEAEWEKAARGGAKSRYPWGQRASCRQAILDEVSPAPSAREPDGCGRDSTWPVASRAPNGFGLYDMAGNAGEWTGNWYARDAITAYYAKGRLAAPNKGRQRVVRGGSWDENRPNLRVSYRNVKPPVSGDVVYGSIGFRCVEALGESTPPNQPTSRDTEPADQNSSPGR